MSTQGNKLQHNITVNKNKNKSFVKWSGLHIKAALNNINQTKRQLQRWITYLVFHFTLAISSNKSQCRKQQYLRWSLNIICNLYYLSFFLLCPALNRQKSLRAYGGLVERQGDDWDRNITAFTFSTKKFNYFHGIYPICSKSQFLI